ncbi:MAG: hypothetical protein DRJ40_04885 [Thermoprotei archaeon]|nr:MAG: hypothetical protein DRJ40_04640 [Thermoprotei archaeon]RLE56736.1 MAG: hypothetical protein DRJ40_04885 [Thermoprotei archaeon]
MAIWVIAVRRKYADAILDGRKIAEVRWEGTVNIDLVRSGDKLLLATGSGIVGIVEVTKVIIKELRSISDDEAKAAGFRSRVELVKELKKIYPITSYSEKYYILYLRPIADLRHRPVPLSNIYCYSGSGIRECRLEDLKSRIVPVCRVKSSDLPIT